MKILNSITKRKEIFEPKNAGEVKIYACGITVNGDAHLGHARQAIIFDMIAAFLRYSGLKVLYARNWTDVDDRLIQQAKKEGVDAFELASQRIEETSALIAQITESDADFSPRVTQSIPAIVELIETLIQKNHAYRAGNDVYYDVNSFPNYGKLTNRSLEQLMDSVRIEKNEDKRYPLDFALWKGAAQDEPAFDSPFGRGRPGWHIECSAMIQQLFEGYVDIHGGGLDLKFPHHENEIAQSEGANGYELTKYWMHNGLVTVDGQKMSKSLGNFITLKELLERYDAEVLRLLVLSNHYSSSLEMGEESVAAAQKNLYYFYKTLLKIDDALQKTEAVPTISPVLIEPFENAFSDDFNSADFVAHLFTTFTRINTYKFKNAQEINDAASVRADLKKLTPVLGFLKSEPSQYIENVRARGLKTLNLSEDYINQRIIERAQYKKARDFAKADALRSELLEKGIILNDTPSKTEWDLKSLY